MIRSLRQASLNPRAVVHLNLSGGEELRCMNFMCQKYEATCVCKLARWVQQTAPQLDALTELSLSKNKIDTLPVSIWDLKNLEVLNLDCKKNSIYVYIMLKSTSIVAYPRVDF